MSALSRWIAGAVVLCGAHTSQAVQTRDIRDGGTITRPEYAGRIIRAFDFEEMYTNPLPVPLGWIRAQHDPDVPRDRPGFPIWNRAALDYGSPAFSGEGTVHLPTDGGSTSLILRHGELTVFPNADYLISARVRTDGLKHARARMVAELIDRAGNEIEGAQLTTSLVSTRGEWELLSLFIEGTQPDAAFVRIELQLLQPEQQPRARRVKPFTVWAQDYDGGAWFDDVVVAQVPMIGLSTGTPGNIVSGEVPPALEMTVRDLTGDDLRSSIRVFDAMGLVVDEKDGGRGNGLNESWTPALPKYGWYHAVFDVYSGSGLVGRNELDFLWQPAREGGKLVGGFGAKRLVPEDSIFGLRSTSLDERLLSTLPDLAYMSGVKHLEMRAVDAETMSEDLVKGSTLLDAIDRSIAMGVDVSLTMAEVPMELADQAAIDHDAIFGLLLEHEPIAMPMIGQLLDRYGQQVTEWRLGIAPNEDSGEVLSEEAGGVRMLMDPYVPGAVIGVPWAMDRPFDAGVMNESIRLLVRDESSFPDDAMSDMVEQWALVRDEQEGGHLSVVHRAYNSEGARESIWSRVGWLGRRAISSWWASKLASGDERDTQIVLSDPWIVEPGQRGRVMPAPELLVWRTLVDQLGGRGAVEEIDLEPGVRMLLCSARLDLDAMDDELADGLKDGALILWLDEPTMERAMVELPLSMGAVRVVDLFGNEEVVGLTHETELSLPRHRVEVTRTPVIVTGVNPELVQFLGNLRVTPDRLEATTGVHKHQLVVKNPWGFSIRGRVYIVEPGGFSEPGGGNVDRSWEIVPRVVNFVVTGGLEERFDLDVSYSSSQLSGMKDLVFDVELMADKEYGLMRVEREIELGTDVIDLDLSFRRSSKQGVVEVDAVVTNQTGDRIIADLIAVAPKNARQESTISEIQSLRDGRRSFVFRGLESGDQVVISVRVPGHEVRINKAITLP
jgi:hypothetical protein